MICIERLSMRRVMVVIALAMVFYFVLVILSDADEVGAAFAGFEWTYLPPVILLVLLNYVIRAERWHSYLRTIGLALPRPRSYRLFLAGLSMSITPAKAGEAMKALFLKAEKDAPLERGVAVVFAERMSDMIGMVILIGAGSFAIAYGTISFAIVVVILCLMLVMLSKPRFTEWVVIRLRRGRIMSKISRVIETAAHDARILLTGRRLAEGSALSVIAWLAECLAFYLILLGVSAEISLLECVFIYSFSSVIGAVSMMPGGMGTTEATMMALLVLLSVAAPAASFAVILTRVSTLWLAVAIGLVFLMLFTRNARREGPSGGT